MPLQPGRVILADGGRRWDICGVDGEPDPALDSIAGLLAPFLEFGETFGPEFGSPHPGRFFNGTIMRWPLRVRPDRFYPTPFAADDILGLFRGFTEEAVDILLFAGHLECKQQRKRCYRWLALRQLSRESSAQQQWPH
jgi:hypothetical protein